MARRTIVVSARPQFEAVRLELARSGAGNGVRTVPVEGLAARLAGGFLGPIDSDDLLRAVSATLSDVTDDAMGDLKDIRTLPGVPRTMATTLHRTWNAGINLTEYAGSHPRIAAMARIEEAVLDRLPKGQLRPTNLVSKALGRLEHAPAVLGAVEVCGLPDLAPCWRPLLCALSQVVPVTWDAGAFPVPAWIEGTGIEVRRAAPTLPAVRTVSCANPRHEAVEAMRWARNLIASGRAGPHEIAFAAASTATYDDFFFSLSQECTLKIHYGHGHNALHTPEGQAAAALADILLRGMSQERVRRVISCARTIRTPKFAQLPQDWSRCLPSSAPLRTLEHWRKALEAEDRRQVADLVLEVVRVLVEGHKAAEAAGGLLLCGAARELWRRALAQAPATALDRELASLRVQEENDAAACIAWMPASLLASTPRRYIWLLGLNAQSWPRRPTEDPLLPKRILGDLELEETTISTADRLSFDAIMTSAGVEVVRSYSRREATTRRLGVSPLVAGNEPEILYRTQLPEHAMSEPDRLMARPDEFVLRDDAQQANDCWRAWRSQGITEHDGWIKRKNHPAIEGALKRSQSAHSLTLLLRNPIGFMWRYALGMQAPELDGDSLDMDARAFGNLVHEVLDRVIREMSAKDGMAWTHDQVGDLVNPQLAEVAERWEREEPIPPRILWVDTLARARAMILNALLYPFVPLSGQRSYSEVPFGNGQFSGDGPVPWDVHAVVPIPNTGLTISGRIDRVDVSGDKAIARVVDYKTGRRHGDFILRGGRELQRCLYAYAVQALLGSQAVIDAGLLYPSQEPGNPAADAYDPLPEPGENLDRLTDAIAAAETNLREGLALPGVAAGLRYSDNEKPKENTYRERDDFIFALPVVPGTMLGPKKDAARKMLGDTITQFWDVA